MKKTRIKEMLKHTNSAELLVFIGFCGIFVMSVGIVIYSLFKNLMHLLS